MGRRGPAPTPTAILKARGSPRATLYNHSPNETEATPGYPDKPAKLKGQASAVWDALIQVVPKDAVTKDNGATLSRYCVATVRFWQVVARLDKSGETYTYKDSAGNVRIARHPEVQTFNDLMATLLRYEQEFGMTPAARTRVDRILNKEQIDADRAKKDAAKAAGGQVVLKMVG